MTKILSDKPRRDGQETKGSARDLTATESHFNSPHPASPCLVIWQYSSIFEAQLHHLSPFFSWMGWHFELYFISPLWISVTWSGLPGNKSTWIVQNGYILMYFAVSLTKQLCSSKTLERNILSAPGVLVTTFLFISSSDRDSKRKKTAETPSCGHTHVIKTIRNIRNLP